jgi:thioesterase domain-containing protein/acyl carrier protein
VNAHIILEEYPSDSKDDAHPDKTNHVGLPISRDVENHSSLSKVISEPDINTMDADEKNYLLQLIDSLWSISVTEMKEDTVLVDLDLGSMQITQLIQAVNLKFNTKIVLGDIFQLDTFGELLNFITGKIESNSSFSSDLDKHIIPHKQGKGTRIGIIIPGVLNMVGTGFELAKKAKEETVYEILTIGVDGDKPLNTLGSIAQHYFEMIKSIDSSKKITLYGHSFGGVVVYEVLKLLKNTSIQIEKVILIDSSSSPIKRSGIEKIFAFVSFLHKQYNLPEDDDRILMFSHKVINNPKKNREDLLYKYLIKNGGIVDKEFFSRLYLMYIISAELTYQLKGRLDLDVFFIKARKPLLEGEDFSSGWLPYFRNVKIIESDGDHFNIIRKPFVEEWLEKLN